MERLYIMSPNISHWVYQDRCICSSSNYNVNGILERKTDSKIVRIRRRKQRLRQENKGLKTLK